MHWTLPLSYAQLVRKCAFILAILSARRHSELFGLKSDVNHLQISINFVQLVPASLSKTDRAGHLDPAICLRSWREDASICPVAVIRTLLEARDVLDIRHDRLFFNARHLDSIDHTFRGFISRCLRDAGIYTPPGSTRATAASSALGRAVCMGNILRMGSGQPVPLSSDTMQLCDRSVRFWSSALSSPICHLVAQR
jgi:hypothetical protein